MGRIRGRGYPGRNTFFGGPIAIIEPEPAEAGTVSRTLSDSLTLSETLLRDGVYTRGLTESLSLTEALSRTGVYTRDLYDTVGISRVDLPGASGDYINTPDAAWNRLTGDIDVRVKLAAVDWGPPALANICGKHGATGTSRSWYVRLNDAKTILFGWSTDGTAPGVIEATSTVGTGFADGSTHWVRATLDVDNGASGYDVKFYTSEDGRVWTQLGATVTGGATTSVHAGDWPVTIGPTGFGNEYPTDAAYYNFELRSTIDGSPIANVNFADETGWNDARTTFTDPQAHVWTLQGDAAPLGGEIVERLLREGVFTREPSDPLSLTENLVRTGVYTRLFLDALTLTDVLLTKDKYKRILADALTLTDSITRTGVYTRSPSDPLTLTENLQRTGVYTRDILDPLTLTENLSRDGVFTRQLSEALTLTENFIEASVFQRVLSDSLTLTDTIVRTGVFTRLMADALTLVDTLTYELDTVGGTTVSKTLRDNLSLTENLKTQDTFDRVLSDAGAFADTLTRDILATRILQDSVPLTEALLREVLNTRDLADALGLTESLVRDVVNTRILNDSSTLSDTLLYELVRGVVLRDTLTLTENLIRTGVFTRDMSQALTLTENLAVAVNDAPVVSAGGRHWRWWLWQALRRQKPHMDDSSLWG
jgi:hypothetical protein